MRPMLERKRYYEFGRISIPSAHLFLIEKLSNLRYRRLVGTELWEFVAVFYVRQVAVSRS